MAKAVEPDAGVPVWSHDGIICTGETYKDAVKLTFAKGAALKDPSRLFNASLEGNARRAIDFHEGDKIDAKALQGAHSRRRGAEHVQGQKLIHGLKYFPWDCPHTPFVPADAATQQRKPQVGWVRRAAP